MAECDRTATSAPARDSALMAQLREATAAVHAATEDLPLMRALLGPAVTIGLYRRYLTALYGVYLATEPCLYSALPASVLTSLAVQPKLPALQLDLSRLDVAPPLPPARWSAALRRSVDGPAAALGGLYVLEGATLGGRVIARRLRRAFGGGAADLPLRFLDGQQQEPGWAWRDFGRRLERAASDCGVPQGAVVAGAVAVFAAMHRALAEADAGQDDPAGRDEPDGRNEAVERRGSHGTSNAG